MQGISVLLADDDPNIAEFLRLYFNQQGIELLEAKDGHEAMELAKKETPDVILLDVMMPGMDGFEVCRRIRQSDVDTPVIMLTAKGDEMDRVVGLELGADDYMVKPFSPRELTARMKAIMRRLPGQQSGNKTESGEETPEEMDEVLRFSDLCIDGLRREVTVKAEKVRLRPKEFALLYFLARSPGRVYSRQQLLEQVWDYDYFGDIRTVDVHVKQLRKKLQCLECEVLHTVWGVGYKFEAENG